MKLLPRWRWMPAIPLLALLAPPIPGFAADTAGARWPQFRGPDAGGVDTTAALPVAWDLGTGDHVRWKVEIPGLAHSSPIVWGDRIYVTTAVRPGTEELKIGLYGDIEPVVDKEPQQWRLLALDLATGRRLWETNALDAVPRVQRHPKSTHCNSTPATDGTHIVAMFGSEGLYCFDTVGRPRWKRDFGKLDSGYYEVPSAQWGFASSPVVRDGRVYVLADVQKGSFVAALDAEDGHTLWSTERRDVPTWGTPALVKSENRLQVVVNGWHHTGGYDAATGRELWRLDGGGDIPVPTPIHANGLLYLTSAHGKSRPMRAIRPSAQGDITPPDVGATNASIVWAHARQGDYMQTPIVVGTNLWGCLDNGVLTCFDAATGKIRYGERLVNGGQGFTASPVSDGRHLYCTSENGDVYVVDAKPEFKVVATNRLGESCLASPAIAGGRLLFRTRGHLVAVAE